MALNRSAKRESVEFLLGGVLSPIESPGDDWIKKQLLSAVYWQQQVRRTKNEPQKKTYQFAYKRAFEAFLHHPTTATLSRATLQQWLNWATWIVSKFQRCSSPVEGRNGYLSQLYHNRRGLSARRLKVMTIIHNFHLQRGDGSTAAERLFGQKFPNLFEWVVSQMGELPTQAKEKKTFSRHNSFFYSYPLDKFHQCSFDSLLA